MEIILGKTAGFCYGVRNAVTKSEMVLKENESVSCLGELVHNGEVIKKLEKMGLKVINSLQEAEKKVIIRAHGIPKETYKEAENLGLEIFDFTCPSVLKIHNIVEEHAKNGDFIFLIGNKKHPEIIGTISFCGRNSHLLETKEEIDDAIKHLKDSKIKKLFIVAQTTFSVDLFKKMVEEIKGKLDNSIEVEVRNTICNATEIRQKETEEIAKKVQCMIIIGGKNSSNTKKLYEIAKKNCSNSFIIETKEELNIDEIKKFEKIGVMAGASTPNQCINDVIEQIGD